ncbi:ATPase AAA [Saccharothrix sp. NRRL B-16348]|uniref:ATP-binding protein n=1 Tax=Saccharothrix sp. NRRL B-16348 TaxID=1415542 RepID=UPI0006AD9693|nr:ATP-binding protein [Saccharothrix sp. NRRL B-16348]KOX15311.1 ATPase AAA [Saccharothrix sp. NRRL B-16348]
MTEQQRKALATLRFISAETSDNVWETSPSHVDGLHNRAEEQIRAGIADAKRSTGASPLGLVLQGRKGVGKTHLLGSVRRMVQREGGYFFLVELTTGHEFWNDVAEALRSELRRSTDDGELQLTVLLRQLCETAGVSGTVAGAITGATPLTPHDLDVFLSHLREVDGRIAYECGDTIRALALYASEHADIGMSHLLGLAEGSREWGLLPRAKQPQTLVRDISRVLAMTGPCVIAVDQLDTLINIDQDETDTKVTSPELKGELALIADGLMKLRQKTSRTLSIVACLPNTWKKLHDVASDTVKDRFAETAILGAITDPSVGRALVQRWLEEVYRRNDITPPHPSWPVADSAFTEGWVFRTPRQLLRSIHTHAEACLNGEIRELTSFDEKPDEPRPPVEVVGPEPDYFQGFDAEFERLREKADISAAALQRHNEDEVMPALLSAGLKSWINEVGNDDLAWQAEQLQGGSDVHARLLRTVNEDLDTDERWGFRLIASAQGNSVLNRMRKVRDAARFGSQNRHLVLLRNSNGGWTGKVTRAEVAELEQAGGRWVEISDDDLRTFSALKEMLSSQTHQLLSWLVARKPASRTTFLREVLPGADRSGSERSAAGHQETRPPPVGEQGPATPPSPTEIVLGMDGEIRIELESLRKHAIVFAGSGSGKTVLLRRIVEECALRGVSAIVLDPNNDLARLGDAWPEPPGDWLPGDAGRAAEYFENTEVVLWTPGRAGGRPLSFHPLPDFAEVRGDVDEFAASVEAALARLVPHAKAGGDSKSAARGRAVLKEALTHYAHTDGRDLSAFIDVLDDLPEGLSKLSTARATAADLAETLRAAMVNDPLLGGAGEATDPAVLLTPTPGKRARISVISFVGLPSEEQRQGFVSQLQLEVFAWIKRNPAVDRPLGGLLVMDEAQTIAPSSGWTASTQSTILLASQARKYGLGLLLATQAPKGVHNQVVGNATTQFFGRLQSPAQIAAATEMARAKGSSVVDISRLERGQFYATGETFGFRRMRTPLCLSHHPPSPLRLEEVLDRARDGRD